MDRCLERDVRKEGSLSSTDPRAKREDRKEGSLSPSYDGAASGDATGC